MAAATIIEEVQTTDPSKEIVVLTVSDGETYVSRKFKNIRGAHATGNANVTAHLNVSFSGQTATINWTNQTDKKATITLYGVGGQ